MASKSFQAPNGTQDSYPIDLLRRRWLIEHWRRVSTRHGFEEIDGPTFEHLNLYKTKSGEGIVSELFSFRRTGGKDDYALRPEFTPTLARMYAAKANSLPKPTKWFCTGNFFRAERPQRGRRREFWQWNADVIGLDVDVQQLNAEGAEKDAKIAESKARMDAEVIACVIELMRTVGLTSADVRVRIGSRRIVDQIFRSLGIQEAHFSALYDVLDRRPKLPKEVSQEHAHNRGLDLEHFDAAVEMCHAVLGGSASAKVESESSIHGKQKIDISSFRSEIESLASALDAHSVPEGLEPALERAAEYKLHNWIIPDFNIARGLAYYTGTVFEVIADGERAVAGGGRYDGLIELFGGPPTPAVGFGMGDVVLTNLLTDKGLMPGDAELMEWAGLCPDVFVIAAGYNAAEQVRPVCAQLRSQGLHARHSYKPKKLAKQLKEASSLGSHVALLIEDAESAKIKHLKGDGGESEPMPIDQALSKLAEEFRPSNAPPARAR